MWLQKVVNISFISVKQRKHHGNINLHYKNTNPNEDKTMTFDPSSCIVITSLSERVLRLSKAVERKIKQLFSGRRRDMYKPHTLCMGFEGAAMLEPYQSTNMSGLTWRLARVATSLPILSQIAQRHLRHETAVVWVIATICTARDTCHYTDEQTVIQLLQIYWILLIAAISCKRANDSFLGRNILYCSFRYVCLDIFSICTFSHVIFTATFTFKTFCFLTLYSVWE